MRVPEAPREAQKLPDRLLEHGERLGAAGQGRAPLPRQVSADTPTKAGVRVHERNPMQAVAVDHV